MPWPRRQSGYESNAEHLRDELMRVAGLLRAQLVRFRWAWPENHRERFWHLTDDYLLSLAGNENLSPLDSFDSPDDARSLLDQATEQRMEIDKRLAGTKNGDLRLARLVREFHLHSDEVDALLIGLLPAVHSTYRHLLGVLQGDPARAQASVGLVIEMLSASGADQARLHARLAPGGTLARERLITLTGNNDDALVARSIAVDERVVTFLFGMDAADARVGPVLKGFDEPVELRALPLTPETMSRLEMLPNLRAAEPDLMPRLRVNLVGPDADLAIRVFATVARGLRRQALVVDVEAALASDVGWPLVIELALREARLRGAIPLFTGLSRLLESPEHGHQLESLLRRLAAFPHPAAIETSAALNTGAYDGDWIPFQLPAPTVPMRESLWRELLDSQPIGFADRDPLAAALARSFQLTAAQIREAWRTAQGFARYRNVFIATVESRDVFAACRKQSAAKLVAFAQRLEPRALNIEDDIVLPPASKALLRELRNRIRHHTYVHAAMGLGDHMRLGRGVTALFVGGSGTGKTMAAEVLASEQHLDLYRIDLASLVSKWVGETEKNLSRVFADAERANCMLFFDEADALFGRRGAVKEAQDRWANLEVNFLLQRIEEYSGVVILATNLRQNMDDAFQRRIHVIVEFPIPDATSRRAIWERLLPGDTKRAVPPADVDEISQRFELTGGSIRNIVLDACFRALADGEPRPLTSRHVVASTAREYQKLARPVTRGDFGRFYDWAMQDVIAPADGTSESVERNGSPVSGAAQSRSA
jgi:hypothetical protein